MRTTGRLMLTATTRGGAGLGVPVALALLLPMEAGIPIPVSADLVMLLVGERAADGSVPLWVAVLALEIIAIAGSAALFIVARGPGHALLERLGPRLGLTPERLGRASALIDRRGATALAFGRATPGLRTVTVIAAGTSGLRLRRVLPALAIGASVFLQLHLVLGYFLGPEARDVLDRAKAPAIAVFVALLVAAALYWYVRRGRQGGAHAFTEAACPLCLVLAAVAPASRPLR
jgi:membrane protein DedA with SNARE-associated domain